MPAPDPRRTPLHPRMRTATSFLALIDAEVPEADDYSRSVAAAPPPPSQHALAPSSTAANHHHQHAHSGGAAHAGRPSSTDNAPRNSDDDSESYNDDSTDDDESAAASSAAHAASSRYGAGGAGAHASVRSGGVASDGRARSMSVAARMAAARSQAHALAKVFASARAPDVAMAANRTQQRAGLPDVFASAAPAAADGPQRTRARLMSQPPGGGPVIQVPGPRQASDVASVPSESPTGSARESFAAFSPMPPGSGAHQRARKGSFGHGGGAVGADLVGSNSDEDEDDDARAQPGRGTHTTTGHEDTPTFDYHAHAMTDDLRKKLETHESIEFTQPTTELYVEHLSEVEKHGGRQLKVLIIVVIGLVTGLWATLLFHTIDQLSSLKAEATLHIAAEHGAGLSFLVHVAQSAACGILASFAVAWYPSAAGSGVPEVMAYLNGVQISRQFNLRILVLKSLSCIGAVVSGMPVGAEGPMIHIGALIGRGIGSGHSRTLGVGKGAIRGVFRSYQTPRDRRDFVTTGAAAGVTSVFGSAVGGLLFVMEEVASFFPQRLAWKTFVACLTTFAVQQLFNSMLDGWEPRERSPDSPIHYVNPKTHQVEDESPSNPLTVTQSVAALFNMRVVAAQLVPMDLRAFGPAALIGIATGVLGVLFIALHLRIAAKWRGRRVKPYKKRFVLEPILVSIFFAIVWFAIPQALPCEKIPANFFDPSRDDLRDLVLVTQFCNENGEYKSATRYPPLAPTAPPTPVPPDATTTTTTAAPATTTVTPAPPAPSTLMPTFASVFRRNYFATSAASLSSSPRTGGPASSAAAATVGQQNVGEAWPRAYHPIPPNVPRYHSPFATMSLTNSYNVIRLLFSRHAQAHEELQAHEYLFPPLVVALYLIIYSIGAAYCVGMCMASGVVIPTIVIGALTGRLICGGWWGDPQWANAGVAALVGAAGFFAGLSRLTFSVAVIMVEITNDLSHVSLLMTAVVIAKQLADRVNHSLYHEQLAQRGVPFLDFDQQVHKLDCFTAQDIMTPDPQHLPIVVTVRDLVEALHAPDGSVHHGYPVVLQNAQTPAVSPAIRRPEEEDDDEGDGHRHSNDDRTKRSRKSTVVAPADRDERRAGAEAGGDDGRRLAPSAPASSGTGAGQPPVWSPASGAPPGSSLSPATSDRTFVEHATTPLLGPPQFTPVSHDGGSAIHSGAHLGSHPHFPAAPSSSSDPHYHQQQQQQKEGRRGATKPQAAVAAAPSSTTASGRPKLLGVITREEITRLLWYIALWQRARVAAGADRDEMAAGPEDLVASRSTNHDDDEDYQQQQLQQPLIPGPNTDVHPPTLAGGGGHHNGGLSLTDVRIRAGAGPVQSDNLLLLQRAPLHAASANFKPSTPPARGPRYHDGLMMPGSRSREPLAGVGSDSSMDTTPSPSRTLNDHTAAAQRAEQQQQRRAAAAAAAADDAQPRPEDFPPLPTFKDLQDVEDQIFWNRFPELPEEFAALALNIDAARAARTITDPDASLPAQTPVKAWVRRTARLSLDLTPFLDLSANFVLTTTAVSQVYGTFRNLNLRHLCVVDSRNHLRGIITRRDLLGPSLAARCLASYQRQLDKAEEAVIEHLSRRVPAAYSAGGGGGGNPAARQPHLYS